MLRDIYLYWLLLSISALLLLSVPFASLLPFRSNRNLLSLTSLFLYKTCVWIYVRVYINCIGCVNIAIQKNRSKKCLRCFALLFSVVNLLIFRFSVGLVAFAVLFAYNLGCRIHVLIFFCFILFLWFFCFCKFRSKLRTEFLTIDWGVL